MCISPDYSDSAKLMAIRRVILLLTLLLLLIAPTLADAQAGLTITDRGVFIVFPDRISFNAQIVSTAPISTIILEYGVDKRTCGDVTARAFPDFTPGTTVDVHWTWEMLRTGSEPPGATIWYRWRATDSAGKTTVSPDMRVTWIDTSYTWRQISRGDLTLHWYSGETSFAEDLLTAASNGITRLTKFTGVRPQSPINLYIYGTSQQMQDAILYEPSWAGGVAYPANNITIMGIDPSYVVWGRRAIVHELTHLIIGQITFSCGENVPTWLDEGIAVYAEGVLDPRSQSLFNVALASNSLLSVRSISNGFSQHPDQADLAYAQSYSLVAYLVTTYGPNKLLALFGKLRDGTTVDAGMQAVYGFNLDQLEDRWRARLKAVPRAKVRPTPAATSSPIPTISFLVPTSLPMSPTPTGAPPTLAPTITPSPLAQVTPPPPTVPAQRPTITLRLSGAGGAFLIGLILTGLAVWKLFGTRS